MNFMFSLSQVNLPTHYHSIILTNGVVFFRHFLKNSSTNYNILLMDDHRSRFILFLRLLLDFILTACTLKFFSHWKKNPVGKNSLKK